MWSIWKNRNNKVWNDLQDMRQSICDRAKALLDSWTNAQEVKHKMCTRQATRAIKNWTKPSPGRYKCNIDTSFSDSLDKVGIGICIRDDEGVFVLARTEWFSPMLDVDTGEALGFSKSSGMGKGSPIVEHGFWGRLKQLLTTSMENNYVRLRI